MAWIAKYLVESRPKLVSEPDDKTVFQSNAGDPFSLDHLSDLVRTYVDASGTGKRGVCHLFRHTMATLMLEGGADIRFIQAMLWHADDLHACGDPATAGDPPRHASGQAAARTAGYLGRRRRRIT